jgi:2-dehydropantoate 2-reductase
MVSERIYILGAGAIGMALAVHLANSGRQVTAVRTSTDDMAAHTTEVTICGSQGRTFKSVLEMVSLARLRRLTGPVVITAKTYANAAIAARLREIEVVGPLVIMQNGVGVEDPYLDLDALRVYRCVLYATAQKHADQGYTFIPVNASPIGVVRGDEQELARLVSALNTSEFPFVCLRDIQQEVWKKATINAVFNSICPLLEADNGIFIRDAETARLAREVVDECVAVMQRMGFSLTADEVMQQLFAISRKSDGQQISTWQDINNGRETEIEHLNLEIARIARRVAPDVNMSVTRALGEMIKIKSRLVQQRQML